MKIGDKVIVNDNYWQDYPGEIIDIKSGRLKFDLYYVKIIDYAYDFECVLIFTKENLKRIQDAKSQTTY